MLQLPHIAALSDYAARLREGNTRQVPNFDPCDGGVCAKVLFLLEKPGPMAVEGGRCSGSGFVSRNNDDPTAEAILKFMRKAGIPRRATIMWNVVPWWNDTFAIADDELKAGIVCLQDLIGLLKLRAVVMVGGKAAKAKPLLKKMDLPVFTSYHPSPKVRKFFPEKWKEIPTEWAKVLPHITDEASVQVSPWKELPCCSAKPMS